MLTIYDNLTARLREAGDYTWPLLLRLILAFEFAEAGLALLVLGLATVWVEPFWCTQ
jgi:hypothetical protein